MSGMRVGGARVVFVEYADRAMLCETFASRLDMVKQVINSGMIAFSGSSYGSDQHVAALAEVQQQLNETLAAIGRYKV